LSAPTRTAIAKFLQTLWWQGTHSSLEMVH
jgi:hypothetical protein